MTLISLLFFPPSLLNLGSIGNQFWLLHTTFEEFEKSSFKKSVLLTVVNFPSLTGSCNLRAVLFTLEMVLRGCLL